MDGDGRTDRGNTICPFHHSSIKRHKGYKKRIHFYLWSNKLSLASITLSPTFKLTQSFNSGRAVSWLCLRYSCSNFCRVPNCEGNSCRELWVASNCFRAVIHISAFNKCYIVTAVQQPHYNNAQGVVIHVSASKYQLGLLSMVWHLIIYINIIHLSLMWLRHNTNIHIGLKMQ